MDEQALSTIRAGMWCVVMDCRGVYEGVAILVKRGWERTVAVYR